MTTPLRALEFFAGIGLARLGMEQAGVHTVWANDIEPKKAALHRSHFGEADDTYRLRDLSSVDATTVPTADLAWASSPCTDLSLAGGRKGLGGQASKAFWEWIRVLEDMGPRRPGIVVLENVLGLVTSHGGDDITAAVRALNGLGYSADLLAIDAKHFIPQSRPRLFVVGVSQPEALDLVDDADRSEFSEGVRPALFDQVFADPTLRTHRMALPELPTPSPGLSLLVENDDSVSWWDEGRQARFMESLSEVQRQRLTELASSEEPVYRTAYRRTRNRRPVWEVRADDVAGCLRTARGGSSKQAIVLAHRGEVRVRWMTGREYASLMGAPNYVVGDATENQVMFGFGDAVAVPAVAWLTEKYLVPAAEATIATDRTVRSFA